MLFHVFDSRESISILSNGKVSFTLRVSWFGTGLGGMSESKLLLTLFGPSMPTHPTNSLTNMLICPQLL
jgi:hypothetical protein